MPNQVDTKYDFEYDCRSCCGSERMSVGPEHEEGVDEDDKVDEVEDNVQPVDDEHGHKQQEDENAPEYQHELDPCRYPQKIGAFLP